MGDATSTPITRRRLLTHGAAVAASALAWRASARAQAKIPITVYKDANCGCCEAWVKHMSANGFVPAVTNKTPTDMSAIKKARGVADALASCHTAILNGYVIEGHVPATDVKRLLAEKPKTIAGLTIPGMPQSAPGMDVTPFQPYTVLTFDAKGRTSVWAEHKK